MKAKRILASVLSVALLLQLSPLGVFALDENLPQTPQVSTVQENLDPAPTAEPTPTAEPAPEETAAPTAEPTPEPTAEPTATPAVEPAPDAAAAPTPEPTAEPTAAPDPAAEVQAMINALPEKVTNDNAEAVEQALTDIDDAKQSLTDDELARLDWTRYNAAANALSALLGEATTDAVELLDDYTEPGKDSEGYYQIASERDLLWFANEVNKNGNPGISARLMDNITINSNVLTNGELNTGTTFTPWTPIGTKDQPFTGTFDGKGYTIRGLYIDGNTNYVGLFGHVGKDGTVKGTVKNVNITDSYMSGSSYVGGICGNNIGGTLEDCTSDCTVKGTDNAAGGICGLNENNGSVLNCHNTGKVTGSFNVGGVCGYNNFGGTVNGCYNTGEVSGTSWVGGVCGQNKSSMVKGCYNIGNVSGNSEVGGVCGYNYIKTLENSYNIGNVSGNSKVGGVCGDNYGTVNGCYTTGKVTGSESVGSVCGYIYNATVNNCYYLAGTSEKAVGYRNDNASVNCESKTELQFQSGAVAFLLQEGLGEQVWGQNIGTDKAPVLSSDSTYKVHEAAAGSKCHGYSNTSGATFDHEYDEDGVCKHCCEWEPATEVGGYYEISNQGKLRWFADKVNNGEPNINARLTKNITMDGTEWTPIGTTGYPFKGTFDGKGFTISKLKCTNTSANYVGLFGYVNGGTVKNVTVTDSYMSGKDYVGGICGDNEGGTLQNCHTTGTVSGSNNVGGVCGYSYDGTVENCYNTGSVSGTGDRVGGVCGCIVRGKITGCTNSDTVSVSGNRYLGGIAGYAFNATVQRCFNSGAVTGNELSTGGIVGYADNATVQDCGNNGTVTRADSSGNCGGIVGTATAGSIQNCYNAYRTIAYPICALISQGTAHPLNCYYLADNPDTDHSAKTAEQFASGEVAYLLQNGREEAVWGQTLTGANKQAFPVLDGDKVYQSAPCPTDYSNKPNTKPHNIDENGKCTDCNKQCIAYTVTIPATVELGSTATIKADGVILPDDEQLNVKVANDTDDAADREFKVTLEGTTDVTASYKIKKGDDELTPGSTVLTAGNMGDSETTLTFLKPDAAPYAGSYTGTVLFTVSVDKTTP